MTEHGRGELVVNWPDCRSYTASSKCPICPRRSYGRVTTLTAICLSACESRGVFGYVYQPLSFKVLFYVVHRNVCVKVLASPVENQNIFFL